MGDKPNVVFMLADNIGWGEGIAESIMPAYTVERQNNIFTKKPLAQILHPQHRNKKPHS